MLQELYANHGAVIFLGTLVCITLLEVTSYRKKPRREKPDPPSIYGPIRGMYVCYQCDTVFNTPQCPECNEEAVVPLVHLTGSIEEDERITSVIGKLRERGACKPLFQDERLVAPAPARRPEPSNGVSEFPLALS